MNKKIKKKSKRFRFYIGIDVYDSIYKYRVTKSNQLNVKKFI